MTRHESKDIEWFSLLVQEHKGLVFSIAYSLAGNFDDAEECAQDSFLKAWEKRDQLRDRDQSKAWLGQIARNTTLSSLRSKKNQIIRYSAELDGAHDKPDGDLSPREKAIASEEIEAMHRALLEIPEKYRVPLVLYHFEDLSTEDVAKALELTPATARQRLSRGREMLRLEITESIKAAFKKRRPGEAFVIGLIATVGAKSAAAAAIAAAAATAGTATTGTGVALGGGTLAAIAAVLVLIVVSTVATVSVFSSNESEQQVAAIAPPVQPTTPNVISPSSSDDDGEVFQNFQVFENASSPNNRDQSNRLNPDQTHSSLMAVSNETRLNGRVVNSITGEAIVGVTAMLYEKVGPQEMSESPFISPLIHTVAPFLMSCSENFDPVQQVQTDSEGRFVFEGDLPTYVTVRLCVPEPYMFNQADKALNYELNPNNPEQFIELALMPMEYIVVTGVDAVTDEPVAGFKVVSFSDQRPGTINRANEEGVVYIDRLPMGSVLTGMSTNHPDYETLTLGHVNPLDGDLLLKLKPKHQVQLVVVNGQTGAPVSSYRYRVLYETYAGMNPDPEYDDRKVESADGRTELKGFQSDELLLQVIANQRDGEGRKMLGALDVTLAERGSSQLVEVRVYPEPIVTGTVTLPDGTPVAEALIETKQRFNRWNYQSLPLHPEFDLVPMRTGTNGRFQLENVFPGQHELDVSARGQSTREPVEFSVTEQESKELEIVLDASGMVFVKVAYSDGRRFSDGAVELVLKEERRTDTVYSYESINRLGAVTFDSVPDGDWLVRLTSDEVSPEQKIHEVTITDGGTESLEIVIDESVLVTGRIENYNSLRETNFFGASLSLAFVPVGGGLHSTVEIDSESESYSVQVPPGDYIVSMGEINVHYFRTILGNMSGGALDRVSVPESKSEYQHDIVFQVGELNVYLEQQGESFKAGTLELEQMLGESVQPAVMMKTITTPSETFGKVPPGTYRVRYKSKDGATTGISDWETLEADQKAELIILLDDAEWKPLGRWSADVFSDQGSTLTYPLSVSGSGRELEILFDWESGKHGMKIESLQLISDGAAGPILRQAGWAGAEEIRAQYAIPNTAGQNQTLLVDVEMPPDGDSYGTVYYRYR